MTFPNHFPDDCPSDSVQDANGIVFRFVRNEPPNASDFASIVVEGKPYDPEKECQACGLSVLRTEEDVAEARKLCPWFKKRKVAKARLSADWGKLAATESLNIPNHHTWWVPDGKQPDTIFVIVAIP